MMHEALDDLDDARVSRCTQMQFTVIPISVLQSNDLDNRHHHLHCHNNDDIDEFVPGHDVDEFDDHDEVSYVNMMN